MSSALSSPPRRVTVAVAAVGLVAIVIGGAFAVGFFDAGETVHDQVPDDADVVAGIDPAIVDDERMRTVLTTGLQSAGVSSANVDEITTSLDNRSAFVTEGIDTTVLYGRYDGSGDLDTHYVGAIVHGNASAGSVVLALAGATGARYTETSIGETTVYRPNSSGSVDAPTVAVLAEGEFAIGTEAAVADAVAVADGDARGLHGPLRATLADTEDGLVTVAATVPRDQLTSAFPQLGEYTRLGSVQVAAGAFDTTDAGIVFHGRVRTNGSAAARDVTGLTRSGVTLATHSVGNETAVSLLESTAIERDGSDVTMSVDTTVDELRQIAAYYGPVGDW